MANLGLYITLEPGTAKPVTVARIVNRRLLLDAAASAIAEANDKAALMAEEDEVLGELQREEARRLQRTLEILMPELRRRNVQHDCIAGLM